MKKAVHRLLILTALLYFYNANCKSMETKVEEIWKDVIGYEGKYMVSSNGRIKSIIHHKCKILNPRPSGKMGYPSCSLMTNGISITKSIHRIVAISFVDNPKNLTLVNHIDSNPKNNHYLNLEWVTAKENINKSNILNSGIWRGLKCKEIYKISYDGFLVGVYRSINAAEKENNINKHVLTSVFKRKSGDRRYGGFIWSF